MGAVSSCLNGSARQLLNAAANGEADTVRQVLEAKPQLATYTGFSTGYNCLHYAAAKGHTSVLQAAVEAVKMGTKESVQDDGNDDMSIKHSRAWSKLLKEFLNQKASRGETAVMVACEEGHGFCAQYLIEQGADPFTQDRTYHRSAIHYAASKGRSTSLKRLLSDHMCIHTDEGFLPLKDARIQDVSGNCRYIDSRAENGLTALHLAAWSGNLECVRLLLDSGASMMVRTVDLDIVSEVAAPAGSTPLHVAAMSGNVAILQAMLQAHADALGSWGNNGAAARRAWEGDGRIDLRSVTNCLRQLPYHVAWQKGFRQAAGVLNPTVPIDTALETCRELGEGFGPQKLQVLAAYCLRQNLLVWLNAYKEMKEHRSNDSAIRAASGGRQASAHIERAAAAAVADAACTPPQQQQQQPTSAQQPEPQRPALVFSDSFITGGHVDANGSANGDAHAQPPDSQAQALSITHTQQPAGAPLDYPCFSSDAFGSADGYGAAGPMSPQAVSSSSPQPVLGVPALGTTSTLGSNVDAPILSPTAGVPRPRRAPPPPPGAAPSALPGTPFASPFSSPFLQDSAQEGLSFQQAYSVNPSHQNSFTRNSSNEDMQQRRPTVRFATADSPETPAEAILDTGGFTELANARPVLGHNRNRSVSFGRSLSRKLSKQERSASMGLEALDLPALPLPVEGQAQGTSEELVVSPTVSGQTSRQLSMGRAFSSVRRQKSMGRAASRQSSHSGMKRQSSNILSRAASIAGFGDDYGGDCGICLDEPEEIAINGCNHRLCVDCSISLCEVHKKPPLCPFCRAMISGFHEMPKSKYYVS